MSKDNKQYSTIVKDKDGNITAKVPCTQPHPAGSRPRDENGEPIVSAAVGRPGRKAAEVAPADDHQVRIEQIQEAIERMDPKEKFSWTTDGKPAIEDLAEILGWRPSAAERDEAWAPYEDD